MKSGHKSMARREFLMSVGHAVGSTAMLRTMTALGISSVAAGCGSSSASPGAPNPPPPPPPNNAVTSPRPGDWPLNVGIGKSVVILGGGIAGMTTAFEMTRLGYVCTILEAMPNAGGRNRTIRSGDTITETDSSQMCQFDIDDDLYFNVGPARISHHHEFLLGYCRQFQIPLEVFVNDNRAALLHSTSSFNGQPQIARRVRTDSRGYLSQLLATAVNQNALDQNLSAGDKVNILSMLRNYGDLDGTFNYAGSARGGFPGQENIGSRRRGERVNPLQLRDLIADSFLQLRTDFSEGLNQQATMLQPIGGMDRIARAFETRVLSDMVYEAVVSEVRKSANGVRIVYRDRFGSSLNVDADYCVCTIPATVLRSIPNDFAAGHQTALNNFSYTSAGKVAFQSRRFWEQDHNIYGGISWTNQDITQIWYPNSGYGRNQGILVGAYMFGGTTGDNFASQTLQQRLSSSITAGGNLHPGYASEVSRGLSISWPKVPFQLGAWGASNPGLLLTPDENIFFAGEHLSILQGWQEGAILSAYHAIDGVVERDSV